MSLSLPDPRTNPYRPDLAAAHLEGVVVAERFVEGVPCQLGTGFATVKAQPNFEARQTTQALFGETVTIYEEHDGWVWGQIETDGYVGYLRLETLSGETPEPTHRVAALRTFLFRPCPSSSGSSWRQSRRTAGCTTIWRERSWCA